MAARRGATFRRRELGRELRRLREGKGLTQEEVAQQLGFSHTKLGRVESGDIDLPRTSDLENLMTHYDVIDKGDRATLLQLHRESLSKDPWTPFKAFMPSKMPTYRGLEEAAHVMRAFQPDVVFGMLQTEDYARALFQLAKPVDETTSEFVETNTKMRLERKELITRSDSPLELRVIMDEAALRRLVGGHEIMRAQYDEVIELSKLENVTVQVLPNDVVTYRARSNFIILDFPDEVDPVVQTDLPDTISVTDAPRAVAKSIRGFDAMRESALAPAKTADFLYQLMQGWNSHRY
ncbi:helix-turn-helix transcriptional regulator [Streptomyces sp. TX20-6-3]|uniref:helix-turn-helix domain-containing protein n=1 Tax=Streptomyces sp. TX20-6-3 TaxID=3028705 RepID=UPI0029B1129D|nr:helix-turn-helix transcriptional regulator [Streptomyces sp. TX20-6-3]MDX2565109.1 helix-turn-helix transcriptional regulator [Streptomyces sp. TX20-6-3]